MRRRAKSMVAILDGDDDAKKLEDLCTLKYEHQAKWFMNAYWNVGPLNLGKDEKEREKNLHVYQKHDGDGRG